MKYEMSKENAMDVSRGELRKRVKNRGVGPHCGRGSKCLAFVLVAFWDNVPATDASICYEMA
jgi:hypothetical protein